MKTSKIALALVSFLFILLFNSKSFAQNKDSLQRVLIKTIVVDSQHYVFEAQNASPMGGRLRQLSYGYDVVVSKDKIKSYLPYFGRAYTSDYGSTTSPLEFTSKSFDYSITERKKGGWDVVIKTKDISEKITYNLTIFDNGNASLQVTSSSRQSISFQGNVVEVKQKKS